ncbi:mta/sah nucleosidase, putative [Ricinus communis]|uniref:Mta/sah nucleosidase, putative n=1 Tax=Ricinus communis TaxID=3988 RepID=B9S224_RICCO|nr:mta/sah nucleosidase, putative [Ricinus communis]|eukprot:XP_002520043.1 bark storage protein A [Ricinus communis]
MAPGRKIWAVELAVVMLGVLAMAQQSMQYPLPRYAHRNRDEASAFGIIVTSKVSERALNKSSLFLPTSYVDLFGRRFVSGTIYGSNVVYVRSAGSPSLHVAVTLQIMAMNFNLRGIIHYGSAGATNETLELGTVHVPALLAFLGSWEWLSKDSKTKGQLDIGDFNYPVNGENLLGSVKYDNIEVYVEDTLEEHFWLPVYREWLYYAAKIKEVESRENCIIPSSSNCLPPPYEVVVGLNASSSDTYVNNPAYREFLYKTFRVSTVDTSAIAVALGAYLNDLPFIVFHGVSNKAGAGNSTRASTLASTNALKAAARFIWLLTVPRAAHWVLVNL